MTPAKQQQLLQNQSSLARKVYEVVPTREPWAASQIRAALQGNYSMPTITGVLADLKSQGLVKEVSRLRFIQVEVKETIGDKIRELREPVAPEDHREAQRQFALAQQAQPMHTVEVNPDAHAYDADQPLLNGSEPVIEAVLEALPDAKESPLAFLAALASDLREAAQDHALRIGNIASRIEEVALSLEGERENNADAVTQLTALRKTLANLAGAQQ